MCNGFWLGLVLLTVHLAVCGGLWLLARARTLEVEGYFVPVMLLVPLWGPLCVLLLHTSNRLTGGCLREQTLEKLRINEEIYKNILVADDEGKEAVVPLEEALLVNSPAQSRFPNSFPDNRSILPARWHRPGRKHTFVPVSAIADLPPW